MTSLTYWYLSITSFVVTAVTEVSKLCVVHRVRGVATHQVGHSDEE